MIENVRSSQEYIHLEPKYWEGMYVNGLKLKLLVNKVR